MKATNELHSSVLVDLRQIPLAEVPALGGVTLSDALGRVFPESPVGQVPVAAFQSAI
jgi:FXSXX-COOH protein